MSDEDRKKLTPSDPVPPEVLHELTSLEEAHYTVGMKLLTLEEDKIGLLAASRQITIQKKRVFEAILMERGMEPTLNVEIDHKTGKINVLDPRPTGEQETEEG
jgi:hypothetical protein